MRHLAGVMGDVAGEEALLAVRLDQNAHMPRTMARRRDQGDFIAEPGIAGDEFGHAGVRDRLHRVVENSQLVGLVAVVAPVLVLDLAEDVARMGEGRDPPVVHESRVPADMVDMQMRAQHGVDAFGREARFAQGLEVRTLPVVPGRHVAALLVVAKPGVDQNPACRRLHH